MKLRSHFASRVGSVHLKNIPTNSSGEGMTSEVDFSFKMLDLVVDADFNTLEMWFYTSFYNYKLQYSILITFCLFVMMIELPISLAILPLYFVYYVFPNGYLCFVIQFSCCVVLFSCSVMLFSCAVTLSSSCATPRGPGWTCEDSERKLTII